MARGRKYQIGVLLGGDSRDAQKAMRDFRKSSRKLSREIGIDFKAIAKGGALALGAGLAATLKVGFDEIKESQKVSAQTAAAIKSTGGVANVSAKHIEKLGASLQASTGYGDELVMSGANLLLTFTKVRNEAGKNSDVFDRATKAALDLSAAGFGDMTSTSKMLGKALNNPVKGVAALSKAGVDFTAQQKASIKAMVQSGNILGAQKAILKEVEMQVGGSAKAYGATLPGQIAIAKETFSDLAGNLLSTVIPSITRLGTAALKIVLRFREWTKTREGQKALDKVKRAVDQLGRAIEWGAKKVADVVKWAIRWKDVLIPLGVGIAAMIAAMKVWRIVTAAAAVAQAALNVALTANPIGLIVLAVVGLAAALVVAYKRSAKFRAVVDKAFRVVKRAAQFAWNWIKNNWRKLLVIIGGPIGLAVVLVVKHFGRIKSAAKSVWSTVKKWFGRIAAFFGPEGGLREAVSAIGDAFKKLGDKLAPVVKAIKKFVDGLQWVVKNATPVGLAFKAVGKVTGDGSLLDMDNLGANSSGVRKLMQQWNLTGAGAGRVLAHGITSGLSVSSGFRMGAITSTGNPSDHGTGHAADFVGSFGQMVAFAKSVNMVPGVKQVIYSPVGWARDGGNFSAIPATAGSVLKDHYNHVHVSWYKHGGIFRRPTIAGLGEAGAEAIVPIGSSPRERADRARVMSAAGIGGDIHITQVFRGEPDMHAAARQAKAAIRGRFA